MCALQPSCLALQCKSRSNCIFAKRKSTKVSGSEQEKFNVTGNEPSFNVKFDVQSVRKLSQRASVVKKGLGIWLSPHGSCILPNNQTKYVNSHVKDIGTDIFLRGSN